MRMAYWCTATGRTSSTPTASRLDYLSRFTEWRPYEHRVLAQVDGQLVPVPINRDTIKRVYGLELDEPGMRAFLERVRSRVRRWRHPRMWYSMPSAPTSTRSSSTATRASSGARSVELSAGVAAASRRAPTTTTATSRTPFRPCRRWLYGLFERLLDHPNIAVEQGSTSMRSAIVNPSHTIYTGPIDAYFGHCYGRLPYRSLRFEHLHRADTPLLQSVRYVNYPNEHAYTRFTEFKHLTGQAHPGTSIVREYPCAEGDPYYPVPSPAHERLYKRYVGLAESERDVHFLGRLAQYRYYNMDQVVAAALALAQRLAGPTQHASAVAQDAVTVPA